MIKERFDPLLRPNINSGKLKFCLSFRVNLNFSEKVSVLF